MDFRKRFTVHFPRQHDFMDPYLPPGYRNYVIVDSTFLELGIDTHELNVLGFVFQATAMLDHLFQADTSPSWSTNGALTPLCLLAWVLTMKKC